jgi:hypothetical protein
MAHYVIPLPDCRFRLAAAQPWFAPPSLLSCPHGSCSAGDGEGSFFRYVDINVPGYTASYSRRPAVDICSCKDLKSRIFKMQRRREERRREKDGLVVPPSRAAFGYLQELFYL